MEEKPPDGAAIAAEEDEGESGVAAALPLPLLYELVAADPIAARSGAFSGGSSSPATTAAEQGRSYRTGCKAGGMPNRSIQLSRREETAFSPCSAGATFSMSTAEERMSAAQVE